tara:strand:- start:21201 stop:21368 length:168 start_codon:yes stop_codon:yes gene_type:complete
MLTFAILISNGSDAQEAATGASKRFDTQQRRDRPKEGIQRLGVMLRLQPAKLPFG